jgi:hypothetical protein
MPVGLRDVAAETVTAVFSVAYRLDASYLRGLVPVRLVTGLSALFAGGGVSLTVQPEVLSFLSAYTVVCVLPQLIVSTTPFWA